MRQETKVIGLDVPYHPEVSSTLTHITYAQCLETIIACSQRPYTINDDRSLALAVELAKITDDRIQLHPCRQIFSPALTIPCIAGRRGFLMRWNDVVYGSLQVLLRDQESYYLPLPFVQCERLAKDCAWCLHLLECEVQQQHKQRRKSTEVIRKVADLSACEYSVLSLMTQGLSTSAIADKLHLSKRTIETHQRNIYQKLDVHSQREAVQVGMDVGINYNGW